MSDYILFQGHIIFPKNIAVVTPVHGSGCLWEWHLTFSGGAVIPFNYKTCEDAERAKGQFLVELSGSRVPDTIR